MALKCLMLSTKQNMHCLVLSTGFSCMYNFSVYHGRSNFKVLDAVASGQKTGTENPCIGIFSDKSSLLEIDN